MAALAGALEISGGSATIDASTFDGNIAPVCGALGSPNNRPFDISNSTFKNNRATSGSGGAVYASGVTSIIGNTFTNNRAADSGGAVYSYGTTTINLSTFSGNLAAYYGGGVSSIGFLGVYTSSFSNNSAFWGGGVVSYNTASYDRIETSLFEKNKGQVTTVAPVPAGLPAGSPWGKEVKRPAPPTDNAASLHCSFANSLV